MPDNWYNKNMNQLDALRATKLHRLETHLNYISRIAEKDSEQELDSLDRAMEIVTNLQHILNQEYLRLTGKTKKGD